MDYAGETSAQLAQLKSMCNTDGFGLMWSDNPCDISQAYGGCYTTTNGVCTIQWCYSSNAGCVNENASCDTAGGTWVPGKL